MNTTSTDFNAAALIREIGRGKKGARSLSREDARDLYAAMLERRVSDLQLGAIILALRIKGESVDELNGFMDAAEASFSLLAAPDGPYAPVVIPSYNGSRSLPNLTPLLAMLLAREGVPVLVHGVTSDPGRVTTAEILRAMGIPLLEDGSQVGPVFQQRLPAFVPISGLAPALAGLLALRPQVGLRNSTHTLVKILQPFQGPALRLTSYTHPEYLKLLGDFFTDAPADRGDAFLMRGTEGETVANPKRANEIAWFHAGQRQVLVERQPPQETLPDLPEGSDAPTTARWINEALQGSRPEPAAIAEQAQHCVEVASRLRS